MVLETKLTINDLVKKHSGINTRGDIFLSKLRNNEFFYVNGEKISFINDIADKICRDDDKNRYDPKKGELFFKKSNFYTKVLTDSEGNEFKLNELDKTHDIIGSNIGERAKQQKEIESIHCIFLAYKQLNGSDIEHINDMDFTKLHKYVTIPKTISYEEIINHLKGGLYYSYMKTFITITNDLYSRKFRNKVLLKFDNYKFVHNNSEDILIIKIKEKYHSFRGDFIENGEKININFSRFNPSDIWIIINDDVIINNMIKDISLINDVELLSSKISEFFEKGYLIGVSLKMLSNNFEFIINTETHNPVYKIYSTGDDIKPFKVSEKLNSVYVRLNCYLNDDKSKKQSLTIRNFGSNDAYLEADGDTSKHGKISLSIVNYILRKNGTRKDMIPLWKELSIVNKDKLVVLCNKYSDELIKKYNLNNKKILNISKIDTNIENSKLYSKIQGLYFCKIIDEILNKDEEICNNIINDIFYYVLSIKTEFFTSPYYVRYI